MASALAAAAVAEPGRPQASYFHRDVAAPLAAGAFPGDLEAALAAILDDATCCRRATPPFAIDNFADAWPRRSGRAEKAFVGVSKGCISRISPKTSKGSLVKS